ncbi:Hypothetical_protein [Hexamita inflata]|uniref:Hypothetical_protein n=1 Tax=Hexamita inflata TaxID=28002 RepID=A0AA86NQE3_9EUKA|nr:Hypothetical protein HINF_LOCUS10582 [Hexamita inflata]CAI9922941.1 Hypothetical protein HINF_LOCUS10586 [Hexamita inflata]CAI9946177.1 Hypothetical protein HINF_LOCUS33822 [Hexamita inflata]
MNYGKQTSRSLLLDSELAEQFRHRVVLRHVVLQALYVEPGLDLDIRNGQQIKKLSFFTLKICEQLQQKALQRVRKNGSTKYLYCNTKFALLQLQLVVECVSPQSLTPELALQFRHRQQHNISIY